MARGTMHAPKDPEQRRRRNAPTHGETVLTDDGKKRGPTLAKATGRSDWSPGVVAWWEDWRSMPQAQLFEKTDWRRLAHLAPMLEGYLKRPSAAAMSELRMNEERLGATVVDRMRARMRIERPDPDAPAAPVLKIADAREALTRRLQGEE